MACGKPVVATNVAGNPLAVVHGVDRLCGARAGPDCPGRRHCHVRPRNLHCARPWAPPGAVASRSELGWPPLAHRYLAHFVRLSRP